MGKGVKLNRKGVAQLLHDPGVVKDLESRMRAAQAAYGKPTNLETEIYPSGRAIVRVTDDSEGALYRESQTGDLARALDAAGGKENPAGSKWGPFKR